MPLATLDTLDDLARAKLARDLIKRCSTLPDHIAVLDVCLTDYARLLAQSIATETQKPAHCCDHTAFSL